MYTCTAFHDGRLYVISDLSSDTEQALVPAALKETPQTCKIDIDKRETDEGRRGSMQGMCLPDLNGL